MGKKALSLAALVVLVLVAIGMLFGQAAPRSSAADHLDAPLVAGDGRIDINDVYAFTVGSDTVLVMTINPLAGVVSPTTLRPGTQYEFLIDNDGDAVQDIAYRLLASAPKKSGRQNLSLHRSTEIDEGGPLMAKGQSEQVLPVKGGGSLFVGLRDDPFFFDLIGFRTGSFCTSPVDFFAGLNVSAIILQVPTADLVDSSPVIGVWARTTVDDEQVERMGRPVINTVLIPSGSKDAFNATQPADDPATWTSDVINSLVALNGDPAYSAAVASILLPDILTIDTSQASGFLNGRDLDDDVIDIALTVVSNGGITTDCVNGNDVPFLTGFPYLAPPH